MTIQQIYYALTIAECGSINKAAEKLFVAQPTLTSSVKELEHELGINIFWRTHRGVIPTTEGNEFLFHIKPLYQQYEQVMERYGENGSIRQKFSISMQHYSFAVKAFIEMTKHLDMNQFDFVIRETKTLNVIRDVGSLKSEIGILYISDMNRKVISKLLREQDLEFHLLIQCTACVYLSRKHPLAQEASISFKQLESYPCLSYEQGNAEEIFFAEEILSEHIYAKTVRVSDRATMMNLITGLDGYTLCSSIFSDDLSGNEFIMVPFQEDTENPNSIMDIGYVTKKNIPLSRVGQRYIEEIKKCLKDIGKGNN